jgi:hypothetical protein
MSPLLVSLADEFLKIAQVSPAGLSPKAFLEAPRRQEPEQVRDLLPQVTSTATPMMKTSGVDDASDNEVVRLRAPKWYKGLRHWGAPAVAGASAGGTMSFIFSQNPRVRAAGTALGAVGGIADRALRDSLKKQSNVRAPGLQLRNTQATGKDPKTVGVGRVANSTRSGGRGVRPIIGE